MRLWVLCQLTLGNAFWYRIYSTRLQQIRSQFMLTSSDTLDCTALLLWVALCRFIYKALTPVHILTSFRLSNANTGAVAAGEKMREKMAGSLAAMRNVNIGFNRHPKWGEYPEDKECDGWWYALVWRTPLAGLGLQMHLGGFLQVITCQSCYL